MSDLFGGLSTPKWMSPSDLNLAAAQSNEGFSHNILAAFTSAANRQQQRSEFDAMLPIRISEMETANAARQANTASTIINNNAKQKMMADSVMDEAEIPKWMQDHPTWTDRQGVAWPTARTPQYQKIVTSLQMADTHSAAQAIAIKDTGDFVKRLGTIDPASRAAIAGMKGNAAGPSAAQWQALALAEETAKTAKENTAAQATNEALSRGDKPTTTITDKGVTTTFKPAPDDKSNVNVEPVETTLTDGSVIVSNPKTGKFSILKKGGDKPTELNNDQMERLLNGSKLDNNPALKSQLIDTLSKRVPGKGAEPAAPASPSTKSGEPSRPSSRKEYEALPRGAAYINPSDGKTYYKK